MFLAEDNYFLCICAVICSRCCWTSRKWPVLVLVCVARGCKTLSPGGWEVAVQQQNWKVQNTEFFSILECKEWVWYFQLNMGNSHLDFFFLNFFIRMSVNVTWPQSFAKSFCFCLNSFFPFSFWTVRALRFCICYTLSYLFTFAKLAKFAFTKCNEILSSKVNMGRKKSTLDCQLEGKSKTNTWPIRSNLVWKQYLQYTE